MLSLCTRSNFCGLGMDYGVDWSFQTHVGRALINPFPNKPWFLRVCRASLLKTLRETKKLLVMSNFSFYYSVFYPLEELSSMFIKFENVVCKLF